MAFTTKRFSGRVFVRLAALGGVALLTQFGCAASQAPKVVAFVESATFREVRHSTYGVLPLPLTDKVFGDVVTMRRRENNFVLEIWSVAEEGGQSLWRRRCVSEELPGEELVALRSLRKGDEIAVYALTQEENPELLQQKAGFFSSTTCGTKMMVAVEIEKPVGEALLPPGFVPGLTVNEVGTVSVIEKLKWLGLHSSLSEWSLLVGAEQRFGNIFFDAELARGTLQFLEPVAVVVEPAPEESSGWWRLSPNTTTTLIIHGSQTMRVLELQHGCEQVTEPLFISIAKNIEFVTGPPVPPRVGVQGSGRSVVNDINGQRDLLVLDKSYTHLEMAVRATDQATCVRALRAYHFPED